MNTRSFARLIIAVAVGILGSASLSLGQTDDPVQRAEELEKKLKEVEQKIEQLQTQEKDLRAKVAAARKKAEEFQKQFVKVEIRGTITPTNPSLLSVGGAGEKMWYVSSRGMKWRLVIAEKDEKLSAKLKEFQDKAVLVVGRLTQKKLGGTKAAPTPLVIVESVSPAEKQTGTKGTPTKGTSDNKTKSNSKTKDKSTSKGKSKS